MQLSVSVSPWVSEGAAVGPWLPIGVIVLDRDRRERVLQLILDGVVLPHQHTWRLGYAYDRTTAVRVEITVGFGETRDQVRVIGKVELTGLPPRARKDPVDLVLDHVGHALHVTVIDVETGERQSGTIPLPGP